jgi:hypothetical protein
MFAIYYMPKEMSGNVQFPISSYNPEALTNSHVILQSIEAEVERSDPTGI